MKGMATAQDWVQAAPAGRYPIVLDAVEAGLSKKGETQLKISFSIADGPHKGGSGFHHIGTDGGTKYGAMGKKHLRALGVPVDSDAEVPDSVLASKLQGLRLFAELGNEQRQKAIAEGSTDMVPQFEIDSKTGQKVAVMNLTIIGYIREPGARIDLGLPGQQLAPQGQPQFVPQAQVVQGAPAGLPPGYGVQAGASVVGYAAPVPGALPPGFQPPQAGYVAAPAPAPWANGAAAAPQGLPSFPPGTTVRQG